MSDDIQFEPTKVTPRTYKTIFSDHPAGVAILDQLHRLYYDCDSFDADPYVHARNAGRRDVIRFILRQLGLSEQNAETSTD